jgi:DNA polymerase elongation subunit (family B)
LGAQKLNYNYPNGAALVTKHGREIITKASTFLTGYDLTHEVKRVINSGKHNEEAEYHWVAKNKIGEGIGFNISNIDTDGISIYSEKKLTDDDRKDIVKRINSIYPDTIQFEDDGYYDKFIVLKAKNYIMKTVEGKITLKGSSLKASQKEPILKLLQDDIVNCLLNDKLDTLIDIYTDYVKKALTIDDISKWATKKTVTKAVLDCRINPSARLNERKIYDALIGTNPQEGDKVYLYPAVLSQEVEEIIQKNGKVKTKVTKVVGLKRVDQWDVDHDVDKLIERIYDTLSIFENIIDMDKFINYNLVKNKGLLEHI